MIIFVIYIVNFLFLLSSSLTLYSSTLLIHYDCIIFLGINPADRYTEPSSNIILPAIRMTSSSRDIRDLTQQGRHRRGQRLRQCDLIDCITVFQSKFEKSFISFSALVEFTRSLLFFCNVRKLILTIFSDVRACGRVLVSDKFIQCITLIMMLVMSLC